MIKVLSDAVKLGRMLLIYNMKQIKISSHNFPTDAWNILAKSSVQNRFSSLLQCRALGPSDGNEEKCILIFNFVFQIWLLLFVLLYVSSYATICAYRKKAEREEWSGKSFWSYYNFSVKNNNNNNNRKMPKMQMPE